MKNSLLKDLNNKIAWNLQRFADGDGDGSADGGESGTSATEGSEDGKENEPLKLTQSELDSRVGKAVDTALKNARSKWESESQEKIEEAKNEAEKLAKMNEEQRIAHEKKKEEKALAKREADITRRELRAQSLEQLAERELPKELIDVVVLTDADACSKSVDAIEKSFRSAVEAGVNKRLASSADVPGGGSNGSTSQNTGKSYAEKKNKKSEVKSDFWETN